ncbi:MAG: hypothetical protein F6K42_16245 [Leptolyngbya sp. SIO1D8]|nr:hypothetical protein [Leptolyngbya sp. SIO1D8]
MENNILTLESFSKLGSDTYQDEYSTDGTFSLGNASYLAQIFPAKGDAISAEMIELMNSTIEQVTQDAAKINEIIYQHYKVCEEQNCTDPVPLGLQIDEIGQYIKDRIIIVGDPCDVKPCVEHRVYFGIEWDEEHQLYLEFIDNEWQISDCL